MEESEFKWLAITTLVLGFCFSFRDWGEPIFNFGTGIRNFIITTILVLISILIHEYAHKKSAEKFDAEIRFRTWSTLLFAALAITILTNGYVVFAAVWVVSITTQHIYRPRHQYPHLGPWESARIAASGPLTNFIIGLLAAVLAIGTGSYIWNQLMFINLTLAMFNVFPFFRAMFAPFMGGKAQYYLPRTGLAVRRFVKSLHMEGEVIFFGSKSFGIFLMTLLTVTGILVLYYEQVFWGITIGIVTAITAYLLMQYYGDVWSYTSEKPRPLPRRK